MLIIPLLPLLDLILLILTLDVFRNKYKRNECTVIFIKIESFLKMFFLCLVNQLTTISWDTKDT